jgi:5-methylcytosine-specific restriction endonuclease McrA
MPGGQRGVRRRLYDRDPHCHWCGRLTVFGPPRNHVTTPGDLGTIDHLRPRYHPGRNEWLEAGERRRVLACFECNQRRNDEDFGPQFLVTVPTSRACIP